MSTQWSGSSFLWLFSGVCSSYLTSCACLHPLYDVRRADSDVLWRRSSQGERNIHSSVMGALCNDEFNRAAQWFGSLHGAGRSNQSSGINPLSMIQPLPHQRRRGVTPCSTQYLWTAIASQFAGRYWRNAAIYTPFPIRGHEENQTSAEQKRNSS